MEFDDCIKGRRSVRAYTEEPVIKEDVEAVIDAGVWAPSGMNRQPWKFIVIEDKKTIKFISDETKKIVPQIMPQMGERMKTEEDVICYNAPTLVLICTEKDENLGELNLIDSVLAAENMFLKAHDLGLGTCYMGFIALLNQKPDVLAQAGVPEDLELKVPFTLGHPKTQPQKAGRGEPDITWKK